MNRPMPGLTPLTVARLSAPNVFGADPSHGLASVGGFGDGTCAACPERGGDAAALYRLAGDALLCLHHDSNGTSVDQPCHDLTTLLDELRILANWCLPAVAPQTDPAPFTLSFLVLRDFHADNPMLLEDRAGVACCALPGAQRNAGILGVFARLCRRDAKPRCLKFVSRVLARFQTALARAGLSEIASFPDSELPGWAHNALDPGSALPIPQGVSDD